jgi:hypothetical protein
MTDPLRPRITPVPAPGGPSRALAPITPPIADVTLAKPGEGPAERQLAALASTGLINPEQQRALSVATTNLDVMKRVATNPGERHFGRIDLMMSVKAPTPIAQAREVLSELNAAWEGMSTDFHHFRKLFFKGKAALARLAGKKRQAAALRARIEAGEGDAADLEDQAIILDAECEYDQAEIDELQHDVAVGQAKLQTKLTQANAQSTAYALICSAAGKESFTEDDFLQEELDYYLKAAWWCASEQYKEMDIRDESERAKRDERWAQVEREDGKRAAAFGKKQEMRRDGHSRIQLSKEVRLFFEGMSVDQATVAKEIKGLLAQREGFAVFERSSIGGMGSPNGYAPQDFMPNFLSWLDRMVVAYRGQAMAAYKTQGRERLKRLAALLDPADKEYGVGDKEAQKRESSIE